MRKLTVLISLLLTLTVSASGQELIKFKMAPAGKYKVIKVYDGDTFTILVSDKEKFNIRIDGIDAPERTQEYGLYARLTLERLIGGVEVTIEPIEVDKWGRTVARCRNRDGRDIAYEMLRYGMAWYYPYSRENRDYEKAEQEARFCSEGLWSRANPLNPQAYRTASRYVKQKYQ